MNSIWFSFSFVGFTCHPLTSELAQDWIRKPKELLSPLLIPWALCLLSIFCEHPDKTSIAHNSDHNIVPYISVTSFPVSLSFWGDFYLSSTFEGTWTMQFKQQSPMY